MLEIVAVLGIGAAAVTLWTMYRVFKAPWPEPEEWVSFPFTKMSSRPPLVPTDARWRRELFAKVLTPMRLKARELGYALGVHGSAERDLDVIAAPWTEDAVAALDLAVELRNEVGRVLGFTVALGGPHPKAPPHPHGRVGYAIHLVSPEAMTVGEDDSISSPYIDLAILPRITEVPLEP